MTAIDLFAASHYLNVKRLLVCGSRTVTREHLPLIRAELACVQPGTTIVHGDQGVFELHEGEYRCISGADCLAAEVAKELGLPVWAVQAKWTLYGKAAGTRRNIEMLDSGVQMVTAFWDGASPGTAHTLREARKRRIPCRVIGI